MFKYYWFEDIMTGEEFFCQAQDLFTAYEIMELEGFPDNLLKFHGILPQHIALTSGYDIY